MTRNPAFEFQHALTVRNVVARFKGAMEHDSPEALKKYLHEHPNADKANHTVKKTEEKGSGGGSSKEGDAEVVRYTKHTERAHKGCEAAAGSLEKLDEQFRKATGYKGDKERAKRVAEKITNTHRDAMGHADLGILHAKSLTNIARKHGRSEDDLSRLEAAVHEAESVMKDAKEVHKPLKGEFNEAHEVDTMAQNAKKLERAMMAITSASALLMKK